MGLINGLVKGDLNKKVLPILVNDEGYTSTIPGYNAPLRRAWSELNLAAGYNRVSDSIVVPNNQYWILTNFAVLYNTAFILTPTLQPEIYDGSAVYYPLVGFTNIITGLYYAWTGYTVLVPGEQLACSVFAAVLGGDLYCNAVGFIHKISA